MSYNPSVGRWMQEDPIGTLVLSVEPSDTYESDISDSESLTVAYSDADGNGPVTTAAIKSAVNTTVDEFGIGAVISNVHLLEYIDGANTYQFEKSNPISGLDASGLDTFELNRKLGAKPNEKDVVRSNYNPFTHTFVYTADLVNGKWVLKHTYSWGNTGGLTTWHEDTCEDTNAANQALASGYMGEQVHKEINNFDSFIEQAYEHIKDSNHWNLLYIRNCKAEAGDLEDEAANIWSLSSGPN